MTVLLQNDFANQNLVTSKLRDKQFPMEVKLELEKGNQFLC